MKLAVQQKIGDPFRARLSRLDPDHKIRAILMLKTDTPADAHRGEVSRADRQARIAAVRALAAHALPEVDSILHRFSGRRLSNTPDALGSISVETTAAGITALAASEHVNAILEDQPISLAR